MLMGHLSSMIYNIYYINEWIFTFDSIYEQITKSKARVNTPNLKLIIAYFIFAYFEKDFVI